MKQLQLIPEPATPAEWCALWNVPLFEEIPAPGLATAKDMDPFADWPARNHPRMGAWLREKYLKPGKLAADPMYGAGALWASWRPHYACDVEPAAYRGGACQTGDARTWRPPCLMDLVKFSPPYLQNHDSGKSEHQKQLVESKGLTAMQAFGNSPGNLGRMHPREFFIAMRQVYEIVRTYISCTGRMIVILRDMIRSGQGLDHVGRHIGQMRFAGWHVEGVHPRDLERPTGMMQWKVSSDPETPWTRYEWAVVCRWAR